MTEIGNSEDVLDVRDIIERYEHLESELTEAWEGEGNSSRISLEQWINEAAADDRHTLQDAATEYHALGALLDDLEGYGGDHEWRGSWYPITLVRDSYFKDYAQELAEDIGAINADAAWPNNCIDWDQAARELRMDYGAAEFDGVTYWYR